MRRAAVILVILLALGVVVAILAVVKVNSGPGGRTVSVATQPVVGKAYPHAASASLGRLGLMRQATVEADVPEEFRGRILGIIDDTHRQMTAALDDDSLGPTTREARMGEIQENFGRVSNEEGDREYARAMRDQLGVIWFELDLLSRRRLLPLMFEKLEMTADQRAQANAAFKEVSVVLRKEPAGGAPNERSMQAMLTGRDKLHALLTGPQREKLTQALHDEQKARQQPRLSSGTTRPATQAVTRLMRSAATQASQPTSQQTR